jgi:putative spermidine/putrescine transport system permease protein
LSSRPARYSLFLLAGPAALVLLVLFFAPLSHILDLSFREPIAGSLRLKAGHGLSAYIQVLTDFYYGAALMRTLLLSLAVTITCATFGFPLSYFLWRTDPRWKGTLTLLVIAPVLISIVVRAYGWVVLLGDNGLLNQALVNLAIIAAPLQIMYTMTAVFIGLLHVQLPFMVLAVLTALERIDPFLIDAAETLGASRFKAVMLVILPLSLPGLITGSILVFTLCMTAFVTPIFLGGSGAQVMTTLIYGQFTTAFNWPLGSALAVILAAASLGAAILLRAGLQRTATMRRLEDGGRVT